MNRTYTLLNGSHISAFVWTDVARVETFRDVIEVRTIDKNGQHSEKETKHKLGKDVTAGEPRAYFHYNGEKVYVNNFDYMEVPDLVEKIEEGIRTNSQWIVNDDEILATLLMKHSEIGFIVDLPVYDTLISCIGLALVRDEKATVLGVLKTDGQYPIDNWSYKVTIEAEDESLHGIVSSDTYYFSTFCQFIRSGRITIVNKEDYKQKQKALIEQAKLERRKPLNRIKALFEKKNKKK